MLILPLVVLCKGLPVSSDGCARSIESMERADYFNRTKEFNINLRERKEIEKIEEWKKSELNLELKVDENKEESEETFKRNTGERF